MINGPIDRLVELAEQFGAAQLARRPHAADFELRVPMPDGQCPHFLITVEEKGGHVTARETSPDRLPRCCPDRHINPGGTFCLGWTGYENLEVTSAEAAWNWWAKLFKFLRIQRRAERLRRWPDHRAWAHGDAAFHQREAERRAAELGPDFEADVKQGKMGVVRRVTSAGEPILRILKEGRRLASVWEASSRVAVQQQACVCGDSRGLPIAACGGHADAIVGLAFALRDWKAKEDEYWDDVSSIGCCGTVDTCRLNKQNTVKGMNDD
ncbi:E2 domain-associated cysteine-rich protein [Ensifer adhaerens]|jgi:hypothetical protein|uniref:E2 domain-associated cysteine-rich protein n=1 Tax=Ensifer adhaerens TaxID=106592 RepID=UPI002030046A|nr:E2 domain-associated cysteine-rich protein [Ensifer adhaerens]